MELTLNGKTLQNKEVFHITGSVRLNIFNWGDGFYHIERQLFDGVIWKRDGKTKCVIESELEEIKKGWKGEIYQSA